MVHDAIDVTQETSVIPTDILVVAGSALDG
jgi:hypothetical protein